MTNYQGIRKHFLVSRLSYVCHIFILQSTCIQSVVHSSLQSSTVACCRSCFFVRVIALIPDMFVWLWQPRNCRTGKPTIFLKWCRGETYNLLYLGTRQRDSPWFMDRHLLRWHNIAMSSINLAYLYRPFYCLHFSIFKGPMNGCAAFWWNSK